MLPAIYMSGSTCDETISQYIQLRAPENRTARAWQCRIRIPDRAIAPHLFLLLFVIQERSMGQFAAS